MKKSNSRQEAIRRIVRDKPIRTQNELVAALRELGFVCTQATVSRDIANMRLRKLSDGYYVLEEDLGLQRVLSEFTVSVACAQNIVVIRTQPETASGIAAAIDAARLDHAVGTIAGTNTVFLAADSEQGAATIRDYIAKLGCTD